MANIKQLSDGGPAGTALGQSSADLIGFYGATPIARPSISAAITDASGGTANVSTGVATITGTYNSTILANAFATIIAAQTSMRAALVSLGIVQ